MFQKGKNMSLMQGFVLLQKLTSEKFQVLHMDFLKVPFNPFVVWMASIILISQMIGKLKCREVKGDLNSFFRNPRVSDPREFSQLILLSLNPFTTKVVYNNYFLK